MRIPKIWQDYDNTFNEAKKYHSRSEFKKNKVWAYKAACKFGWIDDYKWMTPPPKSYTMEECIEIAKQCKCYSEFAKRCQTCYKRTRENGLIKTFTWFRSPQIKKSDLSQKIYWIYAYIDNENNGVYIGLTKKKSRHNQHLRKLKNGKYDSVKEYFISFGKELPKPIILEKNLTAEEAQNREHFYIELYKSDGWCIINKAKSGSLGSAGYKWDKENIIRESKKFQTLKDFMTKSPIAYQKAIMLNILDEMLWLVRERHYWVYEECYNIAKKYKTYADFLRYEPSVYNSSMRNSWLKNFVWLERGKHEYKYILQISNEGEILNKFNTPKEASEKLKLSIGKIYYSCKKQSLIKGSNFYFKGEK